MRTPAARIASRSTTRGSASMYSPRKSYFCVVSAASACSRVTRRTPPHLSASSSLARSCTQPVMSVPAGPPSGGLYLKPPSEGGLCDGVTTTPSASPLERPSLCARIARESAGVGVNRSRESMSTVTPLAANTSSADAVAGPLSAWVSAPRNSGPSMPLPARYSQIAWLVATMWSSLNVVFSDEPRCPLVPKLTRCSTTPGSGCWS